MGKSSGGGLWWDKGGKKRQERRMTKRGRRDGEHEVGLDRTMGLQVTFELFLYKKARL